MAVSDRKQGDEGAVDLSLVLRQFMVNRRMTIADMAAAAGVSKSAMEKYLAGPSSPRLVSIIALARALDTSLDRLVFGEIDPHEEAVYALSFQQLMALLQELKGGGDIARQFASLDPESKEFADFARNLAHERAVDTRRRFAADRRKDRGKIVTG